MSDTGVLITKTMEWPRIKPFATNKFICDISDISDKTKHIYTLLLLFRFAHMSAIRL